MVKQPASYMTLTKDGLFENFEYSTVTECYLESFQKLKKLPQWLIFKTTYSKQLQTLLFGR